MALRRGILVSGAIRSGSTWVGRMLSHSSELQYIHEPFNLKCRQGVCQADFNKWYSYVDEDVANYDATYLALADTLSFRYRLKAELKYLEKRKDFLRMLRDYLVARRASLMNLRPLMKDPLALFSAEWLSRTFNMDCVIVIRHPAAFVSSLKVKGWSFPFSHLLQQPLLMERYLEPFREDINEYSHYQKDLVSQAILLWKIVHSVVLMYQDDHPDWIYVRHEDISRNPIFEFAELYRRLDLRFTSKVRFKIQSATGTANPQETSLNIHNVNRDSIANIWNWQHRLTPHEIEQIYEGVGTIGSAFYSDDDWKISELTA